MRVQHRAGASIPGSGARVPGGRWNRLDSLRSAKIRSLAGVLAALGPGFFFSKTELEGALKRATEGTPPASTWMPGVRGHWRAKLEKACASPTQASVPLVTLDLKRGRGSPHQHHAHLGTPTRKLRTPRLPRTTRWSTTRNLHACSKRRCNTGGSDLTRDFASIWTNVRASLDQRPPTSIPRTTKASFRSCANERALPQCHAPCQLHPALVRHLPELQKRGLYCELDPAKQWQAVGNNLKPSVIVGIGHSKIQISAELVGGHPSPGLSADPPSGVFQSEPSSPEHPHTSRTLHGGGQKRRVDGHTGRNGWERGKRRARRR